jgi:hypothetical protein
VDGNVVLWEKGSAAVNINTLVTPASDVTAVYALEINDRGEIAAHGFTSTGDQRGVLLLPCDENHPDLEGCDYDLVDAATEVQSNAAPHVSGPKAAVQASLTPSQMKDRMRTLLTRRTRRFGAVPPK